MGWPARHRGRTIRTTLPRRGWRKTPAARVAHLPGCSARPDNVDADILLAPSLYEGFGLTILEAMACGTPTITANVSSLPEVAADAAVLVEPTDVEEIVQTVLRIHQDAAFRQDLIYKGLARVKEFTWKKTAEQTANFYERVLSAKTKVLA